MSKKRLLDVFYRDNRKVTKITINHAESHCLCKKAPILSWGLEKLLLFTFYFLRQLDESFREWH
jgi:hypothetical protein